MRFWGVRLASIAGGIGLAFLIHWVALSQLSAFGVRLVVLAGLYVTLAVSLNLINGITGQFSIGHAAFYQVGAYAAGLFTVKVFSSQPLTFMLWVPVAMIVGAVVASAAGLLVGLPSLRLRGDYLAIVTLGFGEIIRILSQNLKVVGAASGMAIEPKMLSQSPMVWLCWLLAIGSIALCRNLLQTAHGLSFLAVREDEIASSAMGINVTRTKVAAFVLGSALAGAAGGFYAHYEGFLIPTQFGMEVSFIILTMVVLGGSGSITGSVIAAVALSALPELLRNIKTIPLATVIGLTIGVIAAVSLGRRWSEQLHGPVRDRVLKLSGLTGLCLGGGYLLGLGLRALPALSEATTDGNRIRMVIFAGTLVLLMLVRPQGVLGHREFGLGKWLREPAR